MNIFKKHTVKENAESLARTMPNGFTFASKNVESKKLYKLIFGVSGILKDVEEKIVDIVEQMDLFVTVELITEWENAVGIPDDCFDRSGTVAERRNKVIAKIRASGTQTAPDFVKIAEILGFVVTVTPLTDLAFPPYDVPFFPVGFPGARFVVVVKGVNIVPFVPPYDVPFSLDVGTSLIECIFDILKPANVEFIYINIT